MLTENNISAVDRRMFLKTAAASAMLAAPGPVVVQSLETAASRPSESDHQTGERRPAMSNGGFSKARLGRMHDIMAGYVARGEVPGMVTLVSRRGEVYVDAIGAKAAGGSPLGRGTIFRVRSVTKPITAVGAPVQCGGGERALDARGD